MQTEIKSIVPAQAGCIHVVQITDPHIFASEKQAFKGQDTTLSLERVLARIRADAEQPDIMLVTGDLVHEANPEAYKKLYRLLQSAGIPVFCLPGNHDRPELMVEILNRGRVSTCRTVRCGTWEYILLDSVLAGREGGYLAPAELEFLCARLQHSTADNLMLCLHHQPQAIGSPWMDAMKVSNGDALLALAGGFPAVRCILWGHIHQEYSARLDQIRLLGSPSTCIQFRPGTLEFEQDVLPPAYRKIRCFDNGSLDSSVQWLDMAQDGGG